MKTMRLLLCGLLFLSSAWLHADEESWRKKLSVLKVQAIHGQAKAYHQLFLETNNTDGALTDILGEVLAQVRDKKPKLYEKMLKKESKDIQEKVDFHTAVARGEPGD